MNRAQQAEQAYRKAFEAFSQKVQQVQALAALRNADPKQLETALVDLERAHVLYIQRRDEWVQHLLPSSDATLASGRTCSEHEHEECVRAIAEVLWESAGRPEGTSAQDWHRAEEIVRLASKAAA